MPTSWRNVGFHVSFPGCSPLQNLHKTIETSNSHNFHLSTPWSNIALSFIICKTLLISCRTSPKSLSILFTLPAARLEAGVYNSRNKNILVKIDTSYIILPKGLAWWLGEVQKRNGRTSLQTPLVPLIRRAKPNLWLKRSEKLSQTTSLYIQLHRFLLLSMKSSHYPNARCHLPAPRRSGWCWVQGGRWFDPWDFEMPTSLLRH